MITSIAWGIPAVVSDTPAYRMTAAQSGISHGVFANSGQIVPIVESLRDADARTEYLEAAQPVIWEKHCPECR